MAKQLTTFIENQPGALAGFCRFLKDHNIDMRAMNVGDAEDFGIVRVIVDDPVKAHDVLTENNFLVKTEDVLAIEVDDHPGALVDLLNALGDAHVNVDYTYALFSRHEGTAGFVIKTNDRDKALVTLSDAGISLIPDEDL